MGNLKSATSSFDSLMRLIFSTSSRKPLKRSLTGFEIELFMIDRNGRVVDGADILLKKVPSERALSIKKECSASMIEIATTPHEMVKDTMLSLLDELEWLVTEAEKENLLLLPLGTYPGEFNPTMRQDASYKIQESIFGKQRFAIAGRCVGFHSHFTLPRGIFDSKTQVLRMIMHSKIKDSLLHSYNFLIAADPALTTFMQSSPFYQGRYVGKDARIIMYRGGKSLDSPDGLYANMETFGSLPHYIPTVFDMMNLIEERFNDWNTLIKKIGLNVRSISQYGSILDTVWNPVKINPHGTIETRGMDVNHPQYCAGMGVILKFILRKIQEEHYSVIPSEIGINTPFKRVEDNIYVPPFSYVKNTMQKLAAYQGFESEEVYNYCKRFLRFALYTIPHDRQYLVEPLKELVEKRETVSDQIIKYAKKKGFSGSGTLSPRIAEQIALHHSMKLHKEIRQTREFVKKFE